MHLRCATQRASKRTWSLDKINSLRHIYALPDYDQFREASHTFADSLGININSLRARAWYLGLRRTSKGAC